MSNSTPSSCDRICSIPTGSTKRRAHRTQEPRASELTRAVGAQAENSRSQAVPPFRPVRFFQRVTNSAENLTCRIIIAKPVISAGRLMRAPLTFG